MVFGVKYAITLIFRQLFFGFIPVCHRETARSSHNAFLLCVKADRLCNATWIISEKTVPRWTNHNWIWKLCFKIGLMIHVKTIDSITRKWFYMQRNRNVNSRGRGWTRLPKFKFSANFPIGLHVIYKIQLKKNQNCLISYVKKYINRKSVEVQPWTPLEVSLNEFVYELPYAVCNGRVSGCCHIEFVSTYLLCK